MRRVKTVLMFVLLFSAALVCGLYGIFYGQWVVGEVVEHAMERLDD